MSRRDPKHLQFIRTLPCCACGAAAPSKAAHVRMGAFDGAIVPENERGGTGIKPADFLSVPLCHHCHTDQHTYGERIFWNTQERNPLALARALWRNRDNFNAARAIVLRMGNAL